jgi:hypothetical protein
MILFPLIGVPVGTLGFMLFGGGVGAAVGPRIEQGPDNLEQNKAHEILTQDEARKYLHFLTRKERDFKVLDTRRIVDATDHPPINKDCCVYMFDSDGITKTTKTEIHEWLDSKCWQRKPDQD